MRYWLADCADSRNFTADCYESVSSPLKGLSSVCLVRSLHEQLWSCSIHDFTVFLHVRGEARGLPEKLCTVQYWNYGVSCWNQKTIYNVNGKSHGIKQ